MAVDAVRPYDELMEEIAKAGGSSLYLCYQCGVCTATCPWSEVRDGSLRKMLRLAQLGLGGLEGEFLWLCTTCKACQDRCPRGVEIPAVIRAGRSFVTGMGMEPDRLKTVRGHLSTAGNPWGGRPEDRTKWAEGLHVKPFKKGMEVLLFVGCTAAYDPRVRGVARALATVLKAAEVPFGILGHDEVCCGEPALSLGDAGLFETLARKNIETIQHRGAQKVVVISPHSFTAMRRDYPRLGATFEVEHYTQFLARLIDEDRLRFRAGEAATVTYQDPCYLGRHNGVYEEPRKVLESLPGISLVEMERTRQESLCCGGGGGRVFQETPPGERFSNLRVAQAERVGAAAVCTACPYCLLMLEDSSKTTARSPLAVQDVAEAVAAALQ